MSNNFIPDSAENRLVWFTNLKTTVNAQASALGWSAAKIEEFNQAVDPRIADYQAVVDADRAFRHASGDAQDRFATGIIALRALIAEIKTNPAFTDGMGAAMRIFSLSSGPKEGDIKPVLNALAERGHVRISGSKNYAETVNLYLRRKAGPVGEWTLIGVKRKRFPFDDQTPLAVPGVPEEREYMARGVMGDDEVGQDSDIVSVTYAG
ncbi:MAG: hypothetical protein V4726_24450 [Verrucomicrobiota bacterium]